jgi:hypothetical protein
VIKVKKSSALIIFILFCLIFPLNALTAEKISVYIDEFEIHSENTKDKYLSKGIHSVLESHISPVKGAYLNNEKDNNGFVISGSIIIIENTSITSASIVYKDQILESYNKKSETKSEILTNINEFGSICREVIEDKTTIEPEEISTYQGESKQIHETDILFSSRQIPDEIISIACFGPKNSNKTEIAWLTDTELNVSVFEENSLKKIAGINLPVKLTPLSLESFIKDDKTMIIVNLYDNKAKNFKSKLYSFDKNSGKLIQDDKLAASYFYKTVFLANGEKIIAAKKGDNFKTSLFQNKIKTFNTKDYSFENFNLKKDFDFFPSIAGGNFTKKDLNEWAFLKANGKLDFYSHDLKRIYISDNKFGGSVNYADYEEDGRDEIDSRYFFPTRLISVKTQNDKSMLLTIKNKDAGSRILQRLRFFSEGSISGLVWDKISFEEKFSSRVFQGWISDFQLCDINSDGKKELIIANPQRTQGLAKKPQTRIIVMPFEK